MLYANSKLFNGFLSILTSMATCSVQIPKLKKHKAVPKTVYEPPKEFDRLQNKRVENRRAAEGRLMSSSKSQFACANPGKSNKTERKLESIRMEEDSKLQFDSYKAKPLPKEVMVSVWRKS